MLCGYRTLICSACEELGSVFDFLTNLNDAVAVQEFQTRKVCQCNVNSNTDLFKVLERNSKALL